MAIISPNLDYSQSNTKKISWAGLVGATTDSGSPQYVADFPVKTLTITGTFGTTTVAIQGSNDGSTWFSLTDSAVGSLSALAAGTIRKINENPWVIRPLTSGGNGTGIDIDIVCTK